MSTVIIMLTALTLVLSENIIMMHNISSCDLKMVLYFIRAASFVNLDFKFATLAF